MEMHWSRWFHCESSFGLLLVPNQPGIFSLAEEVVQSVGPNGRRMLAVLEVEEVDDLARGLSRLFAAGSQWREKLAQARCYVRYAVVASVTDRKEVAMSLKKWLHSQREVASQIFEKSVRVPSELELALAPAQVLASPDWSDYESGAGEMRSERHIARAQHEGEAAQRCGALKEEENELKTMAERAVDRVTHGMKLSKASTARF
jgi:hypothetical protein